MLVTQRPTSYGALPQVENLVRGAKTGLAAEQITCDFVSRWDLPGEQDDFFIVGPVTMVRVSS